MNRLYVRLICVVLSGTVWAEGITDHWRIDTTDDWRQACRKSDHLEFKDGMAVPSAETSTFQSVVKRFKTKVKPGNLVLRQSPVWQNWTPRNNVGPANLGDAPVLLVKGPHDYWMFGRYRDPFKSRSKKNTRSKGAFKAEPATLKGFDVPLLTTPFPHQFNAPGGLKPDLGGYHAWQSHDMVNWVHHGSVTTHPSRWVTTAEQVGDKTYIYYDFPNDQDPHLYIDTDLTDGKPGDNMGMAFKDPSDGSDCGFIRDLEGNFHVFYENWSPINAGKHSWDSPLAGHAVSPDGMGHFKILPPAVDDRTTPTGIFAEYSHPHWHKEDPEHFPVKPGTNRAYGKYEVHKPEQNAYGDWAPICIGGQYYLFCDFHPVGEKIRVAWFTSSDINKPFTFCDELGLGHPDPDIGFAEGKFYLVTQTPTDYISPGPWVESVEIRVGVDTTNNGAIDTWTEWREVKETYDYIKGFAKQIKRVPAALDLSALPAGFGLSFEVRTNDTTENKSQPILGSLTLSFDRQ